MLSVLRTVGARVFWKLFFLNFNDDVSFSNLAFAVRLNGAPARVDDDPNGCHDDERDAVESGRHSEHVELREKEGAATEVKEQPVEEEEEEDQGWWRWRETQREKSERQLHACRGCIIYSRPMVNLFSTK